MRLLEHQREHFQSCCIFFGKVNCRDMLSFLARIQLPPFPSECSHESTENMAEANVCHQVLQFTVQYINHDINKCTELSSCVPEYILSCLSHTHKQRDSAGSQGQSHPEGFPSKQQNKSEGKLNLGAEELMLVASLLKCSSIIFFLLSTGHYYCFSFLSVPEGIRKTMCFQDCSSCLLKEHLKKVTATSRILFIQL